MHNHNLCENSKYLLSSPRRKFLRILGIAGIGAGILSGIGSARASAASGTHASGHAEAADTFGFLRTCIDKRFVAGSRTAFEQATGLSAVGYWHESYAGGSALPPPNTIGEDYAI